MQFYVSEDGARDHARAVTGAEAARLLFQATEESMDVDPLAHMKRGAHTSIGTINTLGGEVCVNPDLGAGTLVGVRGGARWACALLSPEQRRELKEAL